MSLKVLNWNLEWAGARNWRGKAILDRIRELGADVVCLTETHDDFVPSGHIVTSEPDYGYPQKPGRRKVLLWSRNPWTLVDRIGDSELPTGRFVSATTETGIGPVSFVGVCIPWKDAHVRTGRRDRKAWEDHAAYLKGLQRLLKASTATTRIVLGDFNQTIPRTRAPQRLFELLETAIAELRLPTAGELSGTRKQSIDHVCHSHDLTSMNLAVVQNELSDGRRLSDHFGVILTVDRA